MTHDLVNQPEITANGFTRQWWKEAVVYQIYPRSFMDSNGDGMGDLNGIAGKLDYIKDLGVEIIWLSPHFDSPNADNGYDIRDYEKVMAEFGTMADFDALLAGVKARGMRLIIDLVVNHTSDEHRWFTESRRSKDNPYRDYYTWRRPAADGGPPNDWTSFFSQRAWTLDDATGEYYLHLFARKQPDLNWENPKVRDEVWQLMRFWLDKGVDGFRMDVIPLISKDQSFPNMPGSYLDKPSYYYANGPRMHKYIQEMHTKVLSHYDVMTVGEAVGTTLEQTALLVDERRNELNMVFQFDIVQLDRDSQGHWHSWKLPELKSIFSQHAAALDRHCWSTVFITNHDTPRSVSRYGDDDPAWRVRSAKVLQTMLLTQRGTPFIYQGDELGMTNFAFERVSQFDDIAVRNAWEGQLRAGRNDEASFVANLNKTSRDHSRTPMQWTEGTAGGFTTGSPWLAGNPNAGQINAAAALADPDSVYYYVRALIALRRAHPALIYGDYADLAPDDLRLFVYTRTLGDETLLIALNFSRDVVDFAVPGGKGEVLMASAATPVQVGQILSLPGWSAHIIRL
ncbi:MAG: alpha-glucosidase [Devosia sp.]